MAFPFSSTGTHRNMSIKFLKSLATLALGAAVLAQPALAQDKPLKIGVTAGPHAQIFEVVKQEAAKQGLKLQVIEFTDYVQPNVALAAGDLDANSYQHQPYLDNANADRKYGLVSVAKTVIFPIGIYSKKVKSLDALQNGARIGIPNDPTNGGRALLLLQSKGLIKLRPEAGLKATPIDVVENPKKLRFIELDAAQLPRSLDDTDASAVNTNFALEAGLDPAKDAIAQEAPDSPYANVLVVRGADKDRPEIKKLIGIYQSDATKQFILQKYKGAVIAAW
ncbi:D-methionine ABC transporter substrate-binding protein [Bordetella hinzii]|nr:D-methionine-binding lipoprotein MetQ precursor [Bordetella hinzii]AKQ61665.1 D-methionine-binding lipoprotein MetQ precursor [Bordetella hinzii]SNV65156.1 D-methionine ABC transporter substrate-binding protein [Bordetella hinzii]VEH25616.1 D-methionine ABC transporter substrate-binding protein [Bordetella hinzii]